MGWAGANGYYVDTCDSPTEYIDFLLNNDFIDRPEEIGYTIDEDGNYTYMTDEELEEWEKRGELNG